MIKASARLYILILNKKTLEHDIVSTNRESLNIPSIDVSTDSTIKNLLSKLFESHIDMSAEYAKYKLYDAEIVGDSLVLSYACFLPFATQIKNSYLLNSKQYAHYSPNLQKVISLL